MTLVVVLYCIGHRVICDFLNPQSEREYRVYLDRTLRQPYSKVTVINVVAHNHHALLVDKPVILVYLYWFVEGRLADFGAGLSGVHDGMLIIGGAWNNVNAIAGILNIVSICGWAGIYISKKKSQDMIWPDML